MHTRTRQAHVAGRARERGLSMVIALITLALLVVTASTGLLVGSSGVRATRSARGATQAHFVAESAISEALQRVNGPGVVDWQNDVVDNWSTVWGSTNHGFGPLSGFTYTATVSATAGNTANAGRIVASATGTEGVSNVVVANVTRSDIPNTAPGAIYLAADSSTNATFQGDAFLIDGNDRNFSGGAGPGSPVPGLSTRNDSNTQEAINSLNNNQENNITGLGYTDGPPVVPSVLTSPAAPSVAQLNQIVDDLLARPGVNTYSQQNYVGLCDPVSFGSAAGPKITYANAAGGLTIKGAGDFCGAGILIVEGDLVIQGELDFKGLIIVRGRTRIEGETGYTGNAVVYGSLWTNDINLVVGGSAVMRYSTEALALANQAGGGGALPSPMRVTSLADCALAAAGTGGCP